MWRQSFTENFSKKKIIFLDVFWTLDTLSYCYTKFQASTGTTFIKSWKQNWYEVLHSLLNQLKIGNTNMFWNLKGNFSYQFSGVAMSYLCFFLISVNICICSAPTVLRYLSRLPAHAFITPSSAIWLNTNPSALI